MPFSMRRRYAGPPGITPGGNGSPLEVDLPSSDMVLEALDAFITNQCVPLSHLMHACSSS